MSLTDKDREALQSVFAGWSTMPSELRPVVEEIVADAVNAALAPIEALATEWRATNFAVIWRGADALEAAIRDARGAQP